MRTLLMLSKFRIKCQGSPKVLELVSFTKLQFIDLLSGKRKLLQSSKDIVAKWRANRTDAEKQRDKDIDKARKSNKWKNMTEEEKRSYREKDRLRKAAKKEPAPENWRELPRKWKKPSSSNISYSEYLDKAQLYQETRRKESTEAEREYERIYDLIIRRYSRARKSDEKKREDNAKAKSGMKILPIVPFKSRQKSKGQKKEYLLWKYWKKGNEHKEILRDRLPKYATRFDTWDLESQNPYQDEEDKEEKWDAMTKCEKKYEKNKLRRKLLKEQLQQPIQMPEVEKSEYEKIREKIIEERNVEFDKYMMEHNSKNTHQ